MSDFAFQRPDAIEMMGEYGIARYGNDAKLHVFFYMKSVPNSLKSREAGMQIHEGTPYIKIQQPGELTQVIDRPVNELDKRRFPTQWKAFVDNREQIADGVPIELLFPTQPHIGANLRSVGVHTVEQCANLSAHALDTIGMGAQDYQNMAKAYLEIGSHGVNYHKLVAELEEERAHNRQMKRQVDELSAAYNELLTIMRTPRTALPDPLAMVPAVQRYATPHAPVPEAIRAAQEALDPPAPAPLNKTYMSKLPKGRVVTPWEKQQAEKAEKDGKSRA